MKRSVFVETDPDFEKEPGRAWEALFMEVAVFVALAAGVIANLPKHLGDELSMRLVESQLPTSNEDGIAELPGSVDNFLLVLPRWNAAGKGPPAAYHLRTRTSEKQSARLCGATP